MALKGGCQRINLYFLLMKRLTNTKSMIHHAIWQV